MHQVKSLIASFCLFSLGTFAQTDTLVEQKNNWYKPKGISLAYAGGYGLLSTGIYFNPLKNTELAISAGYTPPAYGNIWTANAFISYNILNLKLNDEISFHPFNTGAFINFNFGKNIYLIWPKKYPDDYYWWESSFRFGPFISSELNYTPQKGKFDYTFFFQCSTNDIYIASYGFNRSSLYLPEIFVYGLGTKVSIKKNHPFFFRRK